LRALKHNDDRSALKKVEKIVKSPQDKEQIKNKLQN
jgi:hypothetical protein